MNNIIAISGLKNSGKDTVANMLQYCLCVPKPLRHYWMYKEYGDLFEGTYKKIAFADALKETLSALFGVSLKLFYDRNFKEHTYIKGTDLTENPNPGKILSDEDFIMMLKKKDFSFFKTHYITIRQMLQCFGTEFVRGFFGDAFWAERAMRSGYDKMIITDLRFKVELEAIKKRKGVVLYVDNPNCRADNHSSENEVLEMKDAHDFDFIIKNDSSLEDLFNKIADFLNKWVV